MSNPKNVEFPMDSSRFFLNSDRILTEFDVKNSIYSIARQSNLSTLVVAVAVVTPPLAAVALAVALALRVRS